MMRSPSMQIMIQTPERMLYIRMSNPAMAQLMETNPEIGHVLNDPNTLREMMNGMRNPGMMAEMMRNQDRAMANIESHPEGFNALRRMFETVQQPMMDAASATANPADTQQLSLIHISEPTRPY
eukprot:TRINITY_DN21390_c0_g1_i1.p2 TRINITY_DN21390_c0_g1~~TRINITY_DN21390_c0_g1_i1.p2  ORF type:complete len:124 (-),score=38.20 TRINITY_DN21390_c0_g1_i1:92-463(-)